VGGGIKAKIGAESTANLTMNVSDIKKTMDGWQTADGLNIKFTLAKTPLVGTASLYAEAKLFGLFKKEIPLGKKNFGKFKVFE
jgi:hypothetical protein